MKLTNNVKKAIYGVLTALIALETVLICLTSCIATRTITTESKSLQRADTAVIIQTKTIESYNVTKNN